MQTGVSRRSLFARFRGGPLQLRPPWSRDELTFTDRCTQCGACAKACPTGLIKGGHAGFPIVDFKDAHCTFCGACREACRDGCYTSDGGEAWSLRAAVSTACVEPKGVSCRMCQDACEVSAIRFRPMIGGGASPEISLDDCTGCGACVLPCPVNAISVSNPVTVTAEVTS